MELRNGSNTTQRASFGELFGKGKGGDLQFHPSKRKMMDAIQRDVDVLLPLQREAKEGARASERKAKEMWSKLQGKVANLVKLSHDVAQMMPAVRFIEHASPPGRLVSGFVPRSSPAPDVW
jgi:hypothetical protein